MRKRVAVAMSGGVDSSVAAALLNKKGYEVIGITMCFSLQEPDSGRPACCGAAGIADAKNVARMLGIRHYVLGFKSELEKAVIDDFVGEYERGRTPNPCVRCNEFLKFGLLFKKVRAMGIDSLATGHYARITRRRGAAYLEKAVDSRKDQTYFLYRLRPEQLEHLRFPLGEYGKEQVRELAREFGLPVAEKKESQEICFVPKDTRSFLEERIGKRQGEVVTDDGRVLAHHDGVHFYTIGQRKGLGIGSEQAFYVKGLDAATRRVMVGSRREAMSSSCLLEDWFFTGGFPRKRLGVKVRYHSNENFGRIIQEGDFLRVEFDQPQFAVTPGQSAVFYDQTIVRGGGIIERCA